MKDLRSLIKVSIFPFVMESGVKLFSVLAFVVFSWFSIKDLLLFKLIIFIVWFLLLYAFSHGEKVLEFTSSIKKLITRLYWGDDLVKCRDLLERIIFKRDLQTGGETLYTSTIRQLIILKNDLGEDISAPLREVQRLLGQEIEARTNLRQVFGESLIQMTILALLINSMILSFNYYLGMKLALSELFWTNLFMVSGGICFRCLFNYLITSKVSRFISAQTSLNQFLVLAGTSVSSNEIKKRATFEEFEVSWSNFKKEKELLLEALADWNNLGQDPSESIYHVSGQLLYKFEIALKAFKKLNEALKLFMLIIFFLVPYFYISFSKMLEGLYSTF